MDRKLYRVEISVGGQVRAYSPEFQTLEQHGAGWKQVLLMAHGKAQVRCMCGGPGERRLSIHSRSNSDRFHLARFPETGTEHSEDCVYYAADPTMSGMGSYRRGVVQELDDGATKIKLKVGLQQRPTAAPENADTTPSGKTKAPPSRSRSSQASMTLKGLLHFLWTQASLNTWSPGMEGKRNVGVVHHHVMRVATTTYAGRVRLAQNLIVATPTSAGQQASYNKAKTLDAVGHRRRLVVVAPLAQHQEGMDGARLMPISAFHGIPHLALDEGIWHALERSFSRELDAWRAGNPVVAILQTDPPKSSGGAVRAQVVDAALMHVTREWIPVDSGYEALIADQLVASKRRFEKPLRFDAGEDATFPDFWLKDMENPMPLEVWGMATAEYQARKAEKAAYYDDRYGEDGWWSWNAAIGDPVPEFPTRSPGRPLAPANEVQRSEFE
ncbi:DUF1173 domain-containing protein [Achromobacter xylosoxidans]|uniref:DUF1173 family protein n=1 Tax=Alcaligenes xylosoxydans xylosoxydans TaxID=85698 RepID=UPI001F0605E0|nr:DUF1173 family protein [Achromobacter xylosoxidans]MCH1986501.1 DUF1173 domain-containing protein [Achromobacter xylosoxidans]MCH1992303.1 DUF1173 domain-containing protein [Achromobacter xylosoxidans]MCH4586622.1 DUF1173 domain-containing protein [Achromobacter xylosoxidans]